MRVLCHLKHSTNNLWAVRAHIYLFQPSFHGQRIHSLYSFFFSFFIHQKMVDNVFFFAFSRIVISVRASCFSVRTLCKSCPTAMPQLNIANCSERAKNNSANIFLSVTNNGNINHIFHLDMFGADTHAISHPSHSFQGEKEKKQQKRDVSVCNV